MTLNDKIAELPHIEMPDGVKIIEVEGLDCIGKETYCKSLANSIREKHDNVKVIELDFPDYSRIYGEAIGLQLRKPRDERDPRFKEWFYLDMYYAMVRVRDEATEYLKDNKDCKVIVVCDRYLFANVIYNLTPENKEVLHMYDEISSKVPKPNLVLFLGAKSERSVQRHKEVLALKEFKDANELDYAFQSRVNSAMEYLLTNHYEFTTGVASLVIPNVFVDAEHWLDFRNKNGIRAQVEEQIMKTCGRWLKRVGGAK